MEDIKLSAIQEVDKVKPEECLQLDVSGDVKSVEKDNNSDTSVDKNLVLAHEGEDMKQEISSKDSFAEQKLEEEDNVVNMLTAAYADIEKLVKVEEAFINQFYHAKSITFKGRSIVILTQNETNQSYLVAMINILLLKRELTLPAKAKIITKHQMIEYLQGITEARVSYKEKTKSQKGKEKSQPKKLKLEENDESTVKIRRAVEASMTLDKKLDLSLKFTGVTDFDETTEKITCDLLGIQLLHGWLYDPIVQKELTKAIGNLNFVQAKAKYIRQQSSDDGDEVLEAILIEEFLTNSQLTVYGLSELKTSMKEEELGLLFRNDHLNVIYNTRGRLFTLVTYEGFLNESSAVWETLDSIHGDSQFVDCDFFEKLPDPQLSLSSSAQLDE